MMHRPKLHRKRMVTILALTLALGLGLALPAQAVLLDFTLGFLHGGSISFAGGNAPLVGTNIDVSAVVDKDASGTDPVPIVDGLFNFTTGGLTGYSLTEWNFGGGSDTSITITGKIPLMNINEVTTLLTGTFGIVNVYKVGNDFKISGGLFTDTKNPDLLDYFGIQGNPLMLGSFNLSFIAPGAVPPDAFVSTTMGSGNLFNAVPIPPSVLLMGTGLLGLVGLAWRRRKES